MQEYFSLVLGNLNFKLIHILASPTNDALRVNEFNRQKTSNNILNVYYGSLSAC